MPAAVRPVDILPPVRQLLLFGFQHVMAMAASPITSVFLIGRLCADLGAIFRTHVTSTGSRSSGASWSAACGAAARPPVRAKKP